MLATAHFFPSTFCLAVKNQGRWVKHLIAETEKLFRMSKDTNFNLILVDFNSTDLDVKGALQSSGIPRYHDGFYLFHGGPLNRN